MKIDVLRFDGTDVSSWVFTIEQFFQFHNTPDVHGLSKQLLISFFISDLKPEIKCEFLVAQP